MPGNLLAITPLNWNEIIDEEQDDDNWADARAPSSGKSSPTHGNDTNDVEGDEDTQGSE
jgi:hypothetical protein